MTSHPSHLTHLGRSLLKPKKPTHWDIAPSGQKAPHHILPKGITDKRQAQYQIPQKIQKAYRYF